MKRVQLLRHFDGHSPGDEIVVTDATAHYLAEGDQPVAVVIDDETRPMARTAERRPRVARETR